MIYVIIDTLTYTFTGIYLCTFLFFFHFMNIKEMTLALVVLYLLNEDVFLCFLFLVMYLIDKIIFKYINYNLLTALSMFTFYYLIINTIDISYFVNLILVIILYCQKYNVLGDHHAIKRISF